MTKDKELKHIQDRLEGLEKNVTSALKAQQEVLAQLALLVLNDPNVKKSIEEKFANRNTSIINPNSVIL